MFFPSNKPGLQCHPGIYRKPNCYKILAAFFYADFKVSMPLNSFVLSVQDENERTESNENLILQDLPDVIRVSTVNQHAEYVEKGTLDEAPT